MVLIDNLLIDFNNLQESYDYCKNQISKFKESNIFHIDITNDQEIQNNPDFYNEMESVYLLCRILTKKDAKILSRNLIKRFRNHKNNRNFVDHDHKGNLVIGTYIEPIDGINYIYVQLAPKY